MAWNYTTRGYVHVQIKMQDKSAHVTDVWVSGFEKKERKYVSILPQVTEYLVHLV